MKKALIFAMFAILLLGFVFALENNSKNTDYAECNNISVTLDIAICYANIAERENNSEICDKTRENQDYECYTELAIRTKDKTYCDNINETKWPDYIRQCYSMTINGIRSSWMLESSEEEGLLGASCGTVTPDTQNECCINKGYSGWDQEEFECTGENDKENEGAVLGANAKNKSANNKADAKKINKENCEAWRCEKWDACLNGTKTRKCVKAFWFNCTIDTEKPKLSKNCLEKEELKFYNKSRDCPEECVCSGSTIKCTSEDGKRTMTIYAGKSGNVIVQVKEINISTNVTLYKNEEGKVYGAFKNNKTHEVMLPDEVKERMQNRTRIKLENESMNLNEEGQYNMNATKRAKLFFMFPVKEKVEFSVNSETGEVTKTKTKWWGFLAKDVKEKGNSTTA